MVEVGSTMVKNVVIKRLLKNSIFKVASWINKCIPKDDKMVLLYSANKGIQFSLIPLRDYLLENNFDKRYRIICGIEKMKYADDCHLDFVSRIKSYMLFFRAKHVFYTTGQIPIKPSKNQIVIHLRHGNANYKACGNKTKINNGDDFYFTYMIASSPFFTKIMCDEFKCREENIAVLGDAIIDKLLCEQPKIDELIQYDKVILWLPTFRKSDYLGYDDSSMEELVPSISADEYDHLNNNLQRYNIKMIVKLHSAQKIDGQIKRHFSHLDIYSDDEFKDANYDLYSLLAQADALIGDYSSVSIQYLLMNKPLAYVIPDFEEYSRMRGFAFENVKEYMPGHIIENKKELYNFIEEVHKNKDEYVEKRRRVRDVFYKYADRNNCERIVRLSEMQ